MYQISKIIQHGYSTVANLQRYGQMLQKFQYIRYKCSHQSIHSRCGKCAKCQIFGTFTTPNTKMMLYEMCQISKIIQHGYSTIANQQRYRQMLQKLYCFIFSFVSPLSSFFLFPSLSLSGSLSHLPQTPILSSQTSLCFSISHSLFLSASLPCSTSAPSCSPRR